MGRDKVLGLSLAILLIGFAGAFCFRNEEFVQSGLQLARAKLLDDAIGKRPGPKPYAEAKFETAKANPPAVTLQGIEAIEPFAGLQTAQATPRETATATAPAPERPLDRPRSKRPPRDQLASDERTLDAAAKRGRADSPTSLNVKLSPPEAESAQGESRPAGSKKIESKQEESTPQESKQAGLTEAVSTQPETVAEETTKTADGKTELSEPKSTEPPSNDTQSTESQTPNTDASASAESTAHEPAAPESSRGELPHLEPPQTDWSIPKSGQSQANEPEPKQSEKGERQPIEPEQTPSPVSQSDPPVRHKEILESQPNAAGAEPIQGTETGSKGGDTDPSEVTHRIQRGDTLTKLARHYLGDGNRYLEIFRANRDKLRTPDDRLRIGMTLRIPERKSKNAEPTKAVPSHGSVLYRSGSGPAKSPRRHSPTVKNVSRMRETPPSDPGSMTPVPTDTSMKPPSDDPKNSDNDGTISPKDRFVPVRTSPFVPHAPQSSSRPSRRGGTLSQRPPTDPDSPQEDNRRRGRTPEVSSYRYFSKGRIGTEGESGTALATISPSVNPRRQSLRSIFFGDHSSKDQTATLDGSREGVELH